MIERSTLSWKALLALACAPDGLTAAALRRACGARVARADLQAAVASLEAEGLVRSTAPAGRRGARYGAPPGPARAAVLSARVSERARLSGRQVNALLRLARGEDAAEPGVREEVLAAHARVARGPLRTATLPELRAALPHLPRERVDAALKQLDREDRLVLEKATDLGALGAGERAAALDDPVRGLLLYASRGGRA